MKYLRKTNSIINMKSPEAPIETGRNPYWKAWYPTVIVDFGKVELGKSPYGEPSKETLSLFSELPRGAHILDVGGGDGRYALSLAMMGYNVTVLDVDIPHLEQLENSAKALLSKGAGMIESLCADATKEYPFNKQFDAVLSAGFAYLLPPEQLEPVFARMAEAVKPEGLLVVEFATGRVRRGKEGNSLIGEKEHLYTRQEGVGILESLYEQCGLNLNPIQEKIIHFEEPYYMHTNLIIANGIKR